MAMASLTAATAARAEDPIQFFQRLLGPPARTMERALGPHAHTAPAATPPATPDLLSVPMPRLRPGDETALGYAPATAIEAAPLVPQPRERPPLPETAPAVASLPPQATPEAPQPAPPEVQPAVPLIAPPPAASSICGAAIAKLGVEATPQPPIHEGACGMPEPVSVRRLDDGGISLKPAALIDCSLAETLATWMDDQVQPIAEKTLGARVAGLRVADAYTCRNRDNLADAKLSEHARGNAIDISAFKLKGIGWIDVEHGWTGGGAKADFLRQVRASACGPFTTVLGPGTDSYHASHFHLDRAQRRTAGPSHGLYCR